MSMTYTSCPYCNEEIWIELGNQDHLRKYQYTCSFCKNKFEYTISYTINPHIHARALIGEEVK